MEISKNQIYVMTIGAALILAFYGGFLDAFIPASSEESAMVGVTRKLSFICVDKWAGAAATSATLKIYVGTALRESLTTDGTTGIATSGQSYSSGDRLNILLTKSNSKAWYTITVPEMSRTDLEAVTNNPVTLDFFDLDTSASLKVVDGLGNAYSTTDALNFTTLGASQVTLSVSGYISADAKGYMSSYDPLNGIRWDGVAYGKLSGTNYELLSLAGWDSSYPKGLALWGSKRIPDLSLTKYKMGNNYVHDGVFTFTLTLTKGGYTGDVADLDLYLYAYSDPNYHNTYGSYGPDAVEMATTFKLNIEA